MRISIFFLALAVAVLNGPPAAHAADAVPKFDIVKNCKAEIADTGGVGETLESCMNDEEQSRQWLVQQWDHLAARDKRECISETSGDGTPSYVELQTCLEMATDSARFRDEQ